MWTGGSNPKPAQPLPTAAACFNNLPSTLESLKLERIHVTASAFETALLPNLRQLSLNMCGPASETVKSSLIGRCPMLTAHKVTVVGGAPSRR